MAGTDPHIPRFSSFFAAGFECTYALAENRRRLDMLASTKHDVYCREDYKLIKEVGIKTIREGLAWSQIDSGAGEYDFTRFENILKIGKEENVQQIWDLNHFDYPEYLDPFSDGFINAFAKYAQQAVKVIRTYQEGTIYIVPLNEISFFAWIGADQGFWAPYTKGSRNGEAFKKQLVRAAIAAMDAIWEVDSDVRFIQVDPFMRRFAVPPASEHAKKHVRDFNRIIRFEAWDMLCGRRFPDLGGHLKYLDIIGVNYYIHNQEWVFSDGEKGSGLRHQLMDWGSSDRISFAKMLQSIYLRYGRPMYVSETGSFGEGREEWWKRVLSEIDDGLQQSLPICGVCAYPVVDRPESAGFLLPNSGLWDFACDDEGCERLPHPRSLNVIKNYIDHWSKNKL